jgi:hypothetical protein
MNVDISFSKNWKSIAVAVSGGADSALLTYLICREIKNNDITPFTVHLINNIRCWKTKPWQQQDFKNVYNWLLDEFVHINFKVHTNFVPPEMEDAYGTMITDEYGKTVSGDTIELRSFAEYVCINEDVDAYFNGVTRNPKGENFKGLLARDIDPTDSNRHLEKMIHLGKLVCHPFRFVDKSWIMLKYKELGLDSLLNLTRSCEGEFPEITYETYTPGQYIPVCGECFWCKERNWALTCRD